MWEQIGWFAVMAIISAALVPAIILTLRYFGFLPR